MAMDFLPGGLAGGGATMPGAVPGGGGQLSSLPGTLPALTTGGQLPGMLPPEMSGSPADQQYVAVTQEDGSIVLHLRKSDGALGPAVKIVNAIKPKKPPGA